jgi:aspartate carbamoyltransferase catalytic subunit
MNKTNHIIRSQDFDRSSLERLFVHTNTVRGMYLHKQARNELMAHLEGKLAYAIFYEPSTRTRFSFETAAKRLGMHVCSTENASQFSSAVKGETLEDSIRVLCSYRPDVLILRHKDEGAADRAARIADHYGVSVINAGDGKGQHPTQALLDLYTISDCLGGIDNKVVTIGGDLANGRTARSLAYLLSKFSGVKINFISPPELTINNDILEHLVEHGVDYSVETDPKRLKDMLRVADAVYWTRPQIERMENPDHIRKVFDAFLINLEEVSVMKQGAILLHPLPRVDEISKEVDATPQAKYFTQAENGVYVRMALLEQILA